MDKKKKHGANGGSEGKDGTAAEAESSRPRPRPSQPTPLRPSNNGNGSKASATPTGDQDNDTRTKTHSHTPDDANKPGPQKKRRKVTHGTALPVHHLTPPPPPPSKNKITFSGHAYLAVAVVKPQDISSCRLRALILCLTFLQHAYTAVDL